MKKTSWIIVGMGSCLIVGCGKSETVCEASLRSTELGHTSKGVAVSAVWEATAKDEAHAKACGAMVKYTTTGRALLADCGRWSEQAEKSVRSARSRSAVFHVCRFDAVNFDGLLSREGMSPLDGSDVGRAVREAGSAWRQRLKSLRDTYVRSCTSAGAEGLALQIACRNSSTSCGILGPYSAH